jgi:hypothetical protein
MPRHYLIPEKAGTADQWILEWSDTVLTLTSPDGICMIETPVNLAHRLIDQIELYEEEKICFQLPQGEIRFPL